MELQVKIHEVKCIKDLEFSFPLKPGIYAITGENGTGKSSLLACAATLIQKEARTEYLGKANGASVEFLLDTATKKIICDGKKWSASSSETLNVRVYYEGSIIFGNRFRDNYFSIINKLDSVEKNDLTSAFKYIKDNLGIILHGDEAYYSELYIMKKNIADEQGLSKAPYFTKTTSGEYISQPRMSTGENLLLGILTFLYRIKNHRNKGNYTSPCIILLDEIELALHSSALSRLINFLKITAEEMKLAVFFSTHSIEILREIKSKNIYYLTLNPNGKILVSNPCFPAYAARNLNCDDGFGNDMIILVEDNLAKICVEKIIKDKDIARNIRIKVLPTGGWTNTMDMACNMLSFKLFHESTMVLAILDQDIKQQAENRMKSKPELNRIKDKLSYLPVSSIEKYLKQHIIDSSNEQIISYLNTHVFQRNPLNKILREYYIGMKEFNENKKEASEEYDKDGKTLYGILLNEVLHSLRISEPDFIGSLANYIQINETNAVESMCQFLRQQIENA